MDRRPGMDAPCARSALPGRLVSAALALALGAGGAAAQQPHCEGTAVTGRTAVIVCDRGSGDPNPANVHIIARNPNIAATNYNESPIVSDVYTDTDVTIEVTGGSLTATGEWAKGIRAWHPGASGDVAITLQNVDIMTSNLQGGAVFTFQQGTAGNIRIDVSGGSITTTGTPTSQGIYGRSTGSGDIVIDARDVAIRTSGNNANGVIGYSTGATWDVDVDFVGGSVVTNGIFAHGVYGGGVGGAGEVDVRVEDASVTTRGQFASAVTGGHGSEGDVVVAVFGDAIITAEGESGIGVYAVHGDDGSSETTIGAGARVRAPFGNGVHGRMLSTADGAGRIVITSAGAIEARDAGILAWAEPRSGSTFGDGEGAAGAARTAPMIHVTSSGDVTVGEGVMDAWVRAAVEGDDETLSAGEEAVLDAIEAGDEMALETALAALPAAYTDDWKTRMEAFRIAHGAKRTDRHRRPWQQYGDSGRGASRFLPTDAAREAEAAAFEILDIPRAVGIRAMALSHVEIADHVRVGDVDPAITAIAEASRTTEQKATLAAQQMLSTAERTVLEAVLTGGDPEAALAALPAGYTDDWKDGVRQRALAYNDGDIQVDVTGGTIASEGDGVHARYVLTHDRNGAIAVTVAEGATVSGGRNGVYVRGAGLVAGNDDLRAQTVTVNGVVMGGTGAGVHLAGGGTVAVGRTGRVEATSGVGILSEGAGALVVTVAGSGTVDGDIHAMGGGNLDATVSGTVEGDLRTVGGGALTLDVQEGGVVTGTVHDPAGTVTVHGSIGRLLYASGGAVTVAATGRITGVEGEETDGIHSAGGDLSVTVAGTVTGDLRAPSGGALTLAVMEGGSVTGTVHDPAGPLTVHGSVGRLLYSAGGAVTVAATGRITGVGGEADGIRSAREDLSVTVAGAIGGDVRATGGDLTFTSLAGSSVTGTVHDPASPLTVHGSVGRLLYSAGGAVAVAATGRITGVEGEGRREAIRSEAGDLAVTVAQAGMVTGDVRGLGDGDLGALVAGTVRGDLVEEGIGGLSATILGTVEGDVRSTGGGVLTLDVREGGAVTGTVHDPAGPLTLAGSVGRILYGNGGALTVAATGKLTGVGVDGGREAVRSEAGDLAVTVARAGTVTGDVRGLGDGDLSAMVAGTVRGDLVEEGAGDLSATISGTVEGNVFGQGTGEHTVTVSRGGTVTGAIHLAASTVTMHGTAGRVQFDNGGTVAVGGTGRLVGIEGVAVRNEAGGLRVTVAAGGRIEGDIVDPGASPARIVTEPDSTVTGTIDAAGKGSTVALDGAAGRVRLDGGGTVAVGANGRVTGIGGEAITSAQGDLEVMIRQGAGETLTGAFGRISGAMRDASGGPEVRYVTADGAVIELGDPGSPRSVPDGADDVGIVADGGGVRLAKAHAPRARVYEALPSVLLGLNAPADFQARMSAPRADRGGWARVEAVRGKWRADASTSRKASGVGLEYDHRRSGLQAGVDVAGREDALFGVSLHHRRGSANVSNGGEIELTGHGMGLSGAWVRDDVYVDLQAEATWYEADFRSSLRGALRTGVSGLGHALGVEAGRRFALDGARAGMALTPRAGLTHSRVSMDGFTDAVGARVSVEDGRSLRGRAGMAVEVEPEGGSPGNRLSGSVDVERELSKDATVRVSGTELKSVADATWVRVGLNGSHTWDEGRRTLRGGVSWATSGGSRELGGGVSLEVRF